MHFTNIAIVMAVSLSTVTVAAPISGVVTSASLNERTDHTYDMMFSTKEDEAVAKRSAEDAEVKRTDHTYDMMFSTKEDEAK